MPVDRVSVTEVVFVLRKGNRQATTPSLSEGSFVSAFPPVITARLQVGAKPVHCLIYRHYRNNISVACCVPYHINVSIGYSLRNGKGVGLLPIAGKGGEVVSNRQEGWVGKLHGGFASPIQRCVNPCYSVSQSTARSSGNPRCRQSRDTSFKWHQRRLEAQRRLARQRPGTVSDDWNKRAEMHGDSSFGYRLPSQQSSPPFYHGLL